MVKLEQSRVCKTMSNSWENIVWCLVIFVIAIFTDVLCQLNFSGGWPALNNNQNFYTANPSWSNFGPVVTTPWPALGGNHFYQPVSLSPAWVRPVSNSTTTQRNFSSGTHFNNRVNHTSSGHIPRENGIDVTDEELREFFENLLENDVNNAARFVTINYQSKTTSRSQIDQAPEPLLSISRNAYNMPTISKLVRLHDNYILATNVNEQVTTQETREEDDFLDAVLSTSVMELTRNFLKEKGKIGSTLGEFKSAMKDLWFDMYSRGSKKVGSSGFEHVFLAEIRNTVVSGLHNWIYFNDAEAKGNANYLGYLHKIDLGNKGAIVKYHFKFHDLDKPVGSMFIGTSPELEMALYSTCFFLRADRVCPLRLGGKRLIIRTYSIQHHGKKLLGSAFPEI